MLNDLAQMTDDELERLASGLVDELYAVMMGDAKLDVHELDARFTTVTGELLARISREEANVNREQNNRKLDV